MIFSNLKTKKILGALLLFFICITVFILNNKSSFIGGWLKKDRYEELGLAKEDLDVIGIITNGNWKSYVAEIIFEKNGNLISRVQINGNNEIYGKWIYNKKNKSITLNNVCLWNPTPESITVSVNEFNSDFIQLISSDNTEIYLRKNKLVIADQMIKSQSLVYAETVINNSTRLTTLYSVDIYGNNRKKLLDDSNLPTTIDNWDHGGSGRDRAIVLCPQRKSIFAIMGTPQTESRHGERSLYEIPMDNKDGFREICKIEANGEFDLSPNGDSIVLDSFSIVSAQDGSEIQKFDLHSKYKGNTFSIRWFDNNSLLLNVKQGPTEEIEDKTIENIGLYIWSIKDNRFIRVNQTNGFSTLPFSDYAIGNDYKSFQSDGKRLILGVALKYIKGISTPTGMYFVIDESNTLMRQIPLKAEYASYPVSTQISKDGNLIAYHLNNKIVIKDIYSGRNEAIIDFDDRKKLFSGEGKLRIISLVGWL